MASWFDRQITKRPAVTVALTAVVVVGLATAFGLMAPVIRAGERVRATVQQAFRMNGGKAA